jgi:hypothetical protein
VARLHLFEIEDQDWFPRLLRDAMTDWLGFLSEATSAYDAAVPRIARLMRATGTDRVVDLCSGGGGPVPRVLRKLREDEGLKPSWLLTDRFPNRAAFERAAASSEGLEFSAKPIDATDVPEELRGVRTLFAGFHHFPPERARRILADAQAKRQAIGIFEGTSRTVPSILATAFCPITVLVTTPFVRPFRWSRLFFTYLVPILPLLCLWDGIVSCLRSYSADDFRELIGGLEADGYTWEIDEVSMPGTPVRVTYLLGCPEV